MPYPDNECLNLWTVVLFSSVQLGLLGHTCNIFRMLVVCDVLSLWGCVMVLYLQYNKRRTPLSGVGHYLECNHKVGRHVTQGRRTSPSGGLYLCPGVCVCVCVCVCSCNTGAFTILHMYMVRSPACH